MEDASLRAIAARADWVLSILPPRDARPLAEALRAAWAGRALVYVDANAVSPATAKSIAEVWRGAAGVRVLDAGIVGGPPSAPGAEARYDPTIYASAEPADGDVLREFVELGKAGDVRIVALEGEGTGVGDASALKMSYAVRTPCTAQPAGS
jgi:3-hydroxyisobutyrate dehydrogenase-like beta-hydroxyacid dehydrogenase